MKKRLLISACLMGINCKYNGGNNYIPEVEQLKEKYELIPVCAEILGGLPTPRIPSERRGTKVWNREREDVTENFLRGAEEVGKTARFFGCGQALFKERSPSCGYGEIYDGTFSGYLTQGNGIAAELLSNMGIRIYGESEIRKLL